MQPVFLPVEDLTIEGYANVLSENMRPAVVPPVFSLRSEPDRLFVPPYSFHAGLLFNATEIDRPELQDLLDRREITLLDKPFAAQREFELWVDEHGKIQYESWGQTRSLLAGIAQRHLAEAKARFDEGKWEEADRLAGIALSADDRSIEPLVIKAAVRRWQGKPITVMAELAKRTISSDAFLRLVDDCCPAAEPTAVISVPLRSSAPLLKKRPARVLSTGRSPMYRMACCR